MHRFALFPLVAAVATTAHRARVPTPIVPPRVLADSFAQRLDAARILGDSSAKVWMIVVSDFQCPYCKKWHDESFAALRREYVDNGKVRMVFHNLPLPMHPNALPAAEAAMCAAAQGKFWPMHDALFISQDSWASASDPSPVFDSLAARIGISLGAFTACRVTHATFSLVSADVDWANHVKVRATPTFIIGNSIMAGAQPTDNFRRVLDSALVGR
jgi:protein-disulfide isomerase